MAKIQAGMSFPSVVLLGINGVIGGGIFLLPSSLYKEGGQWTILAIVLAGLAATLIAMHYAVMASRIDDNGGAWVYTNRAFGAFPGFLVGWFGWLFGVITIAAELTAFLKTLKGLWPAVGHTVVFDSVAIGIILFLIVINLFGPSFTSKIDDAASLIKILVVAAVIIAGIVWFALGKATGDAALFGTHGTSFSATFGDAFYMFTGFSLIPVAAKEMKNSEKMLPRAMLTVMLAVTVIFVGVQLVSILVLGNGLAGAALPVADVFNTVLGRIGRTIVITGMLMSILGVSIAMSFNSPIELSSLAKKQQFWPHEFGRVNRYGAPVFSILLTMIIAGILIISGSYLFLIKLIVLADFVSYVGTTFAVWKLRNDTTLPKGLQLPGGMTLTVITYLVMLYLLSTFSGDTLLTGMLFAVIGSLIYAFGHRRKA